MAGGAEAGAKDSINRPTSGGQGCRVLPVLQILGLKGGLFSSHVPLVATRFLGAGVTYAW